MATHSFYRGQRVQFTGYSRYAGQIAVIDKVLPKNIDVTLEGNGGRVRVNPYFLTADINESPTPTAYAVPLPEVPPVLGTLVKLPADARREPNALYVVVGDSTSHGRTLVRCAKLGGDGGQYWRMPVSALTVVTLDEAATTLGFALATGALA